MVSSTAFAMPSTPAKHESAPKGCCPLGSLRPAASRCPAGWGARHAHAARGVGLSHLCCLRCGTHSPLIMSHVAQGHRKTPYALCVSQSAFEGCTSLTKIGIPDSVTSIGIVSRVCVCSHMPCSSVTIHVLPLRSGDISWVPPPDECGHSHVGDKHRQRELLLAAFVLRRDASPSC